MSNEAAAITPTNDLKLEIVAVPVSDVERAKQFYLSMGWRLDADFAHADWHVIQVTPPGSACSFFLGKGLTTAAPGSAPGLMLAVDNVDAARAELTANGVSVSEVFHFEGDRIHFRDSHGRVSGPDPERRSYLSFASFNDPDGNEWLMQEITARLPKRGQSSMNVATLVQLLREAPAPVRLLAKHVLPHTLPLLRLYSHNIHAVQESGDALASLVTDPDLATTTGRYFEGHQTNPII